MKSITLSLVLAALSFAANAAPPAGHPSVEDARAMLPPPIPKLTHQGAVLSVTNATGYTYIEVQEGERTVWIAAETVAAEKGDQVLFDDGAEMADFYSKTLNRTFPTIIFVSNVGVCHAKH